MVSDRRLAKGAVVNKDKADPELDNALSNAHKYQLELTKENNRHTEKMRGWFPSVFGPKDSAPVFIALIAMILGLIFFGICIYRSASTDQSISEIWSNWAERSLAFSASCLTFIFGKTSR